MPGDPAKIVEILQRADDVLATAKQGLKDALSNDRKRRLSGLYNVIVFGRSVSFVLQNLKSVVDGFDEWYAQEQQEMKDDPAMRFMVDFRNEILKQGKLNITTVTKFSKAHFSSNELGPPPPGAVGYFMGDMLGGSGWDIRMPNGEIERYYVELPDPGAVTQYFSDIPKDKFPELAGSSVDNIAAKYLDDISALVSRARARFLPKQNGRRHSHLRLVKG